MKRTRKRTTAPKGNDTQPPLQGLADPGIPVTLTLAIDMDGNSRIRYLGDPEWAIAMLRDVADRIEEEMEEV